LNTPIIKLEKSQECYECEEKKKVGSKIFCKRCNKSHFVCVDCIPDYLEYERIENPNTTKPLERSNSNSIFSDYPTIRTSEYTINQYSESTIKEFQ